MIPRESISRWRIDRGVLTAAALTLLALPARVLAQSDEQPPSVDAAARLQKTDEVKADLPKSRQRGQRQARQGETRDGQDRDETKDRDEDQDESWAKARTEVEKLQAELSKVREQFHAQARETMEQMRSEMRESQELLGDLMRQLHVARQRLAELGGEFVRPEVRPLPDPFNPRFWFRVVPEDRADRDQGPRERDDRPDRISGRERVEPRRAPRETGANLERRLNRLEQNFDRLLDELKDQKRDRGPCESCQDRDGDRSFTERPR